VCLLWRTTLHPTYALATGVSVFSAKKAKRLSSFLRDFIESHNDFFASFFSKKNEEKTNASLQTERKYLHLHIYNKFPYL